MQIVSVKKQVGGGLSFCLSLRPCAHGVNSASWKVGNSEYPWATCWQRRWMAEPCMLLIVQLRNSTKRTQTYLFGNYAKLVRMCREVAHSKKLDKLQLADSASQTLQELAIIYPHDTIVSAKSEEIAEEMMARVSCSCFLSCPRCWQTSPRRFSWIVRRC